MARLNIQSTQVKDLVETQVLPLLLATGNIGALTKLLNEALQADGAKGKLHPNRLHSLLSNDPTRSLNEATIDLIEQAAHTALKVDQTISDQATAALKTLKDKAQKLSAFSATSVEDIAERLSIPPALASYLLNEVPTATGLKRAGTLTPTERSTSRHEPPDWSYQDTAVSRCLDAFKRRPSGRIGLILPTGAGKTRTALRIILSMLGEDFDSKAPAYWVTHRRNLREQAHRELQKFIVGQDSKEESEKLTEIASRIKFVMVNDLASLLERATTKPTLIIVDEAHHAAATSYQPVFENRWAAPVLLLTATPNRSDCLPIGIDEIAFTITYRELAKRRAVLTPKFLDFPVDNFDWSPETLDDLADYIIDQTSTDFTKVLVLAPRIDRVEEFYRALIERLPDDHWLETEDIGFIHGSANSLEINNEDFLDCFSNKPRAVLVSAQLLLEGFDDPSINAVVLTYPSTSVIRLMQAAGRCVRYAPDKRDAYVVQARNDSIAYHFDQRWLYQEIDDFLRPQLTDIEYGCQDDLHKKAQQVLEQHHVAPKQSQRTLERIRTLSPGETCRIFLYGLPYFGPSDSFDSESSWGAFLETTDTSPMLRGVFNAFCSLGADISDPSDFLVRDGSAYGLTKNLNPGSHWLELTGLLTAAYFAKREVHGPAPIDTMGSRPYKAHGATTWLRYVSFTFQPAVPSALSEFLHDCHNARQIEALYLEEPAEYAIAVKVPLPLSGSEAFLLNTSASIELIAAVTDLREKLAQTEPDNQFGTLASFLVSTRYSLLPPRLLHRSEFLVEPTARAARTLTLSNDQNPTTVKDTDND